jgi:peptidoglycan/xylan/chitin deacetylase (PgdA/CDA1 family)
MLRNDISNRQAPVIAFNIDELLFLDKPVENMKMLEKLKWKAMSDKQKYLSRPLNKDFISIIDKLWSKYTFSIYFITFRVDLVEELYAILDKYNVNYTSLVPMYEWEELRRACELQYMYYFDNNLELLSYIGQHNALTIDKLPSIIK